MLNGLARGEWGFQGYITSDCGAVDDVEDNHHYTSTPEVGHLTKYEYESHQHDYHHHCYYQHCHH
jgi:hypothetical protein